VHPRLNALKARTGRMSIQDPALQNLPKNDPRIRAAFLAEDGMVLVGADFSQVEFRVAAALSEDPQMVAAVRSGMDLHNFTAIQIFGADFTLEQRGQAKNTGFCIQYGGGGARVARMTGLSHQAADKMIQKFFATYPGLQQYIARVSKKDVVKLPSRRRATVDPSRTYANLNYYVQGTARDIFADALLRLRDAGWGEWLWLVVHDEIILQVPLGQEQAACAALEAAMNTTFLGVPITADAKVIGPRWGHLPEPDPQIKEAA
jgi:DNA polymerase I